MLELGVHYIHWNVAKVLLAPVSGTWEYLAGVGIER